MSDSNDFESRLAKYPDLHTQINRLFDIVENTQGDVSCADDAEDQVTVTLRQLGQGLLSHWATHCQEKAGAECRREYSLRRDKKNSVGTVDMALLK